MTRNEISALFTEPWTRALGKTGSGTYSRWGKCLAGSWTGLHLWDHPCGHECHTCQAASSRIRFGSRNTVMIDGDKAMF